MDDPELHENQIGSFVIKSVRLKYFFVVYSMLKESQFSSIKKYKLIMNLYGANDYT